MSEVFKCTADDMECLNISDLEIECGIPTCNESATYQVWGVAVCEFHYRLYKEEEAAEREAERRAEEAQLAALSRGEPYF